MSITSYATITFTGVSASDADPQLDELAGQILKAGYRTAGGRHLWRFSLNVCDPPAGGRAPLIYDGDEPAAWMETVACRLAIGDEDEHYYAAGDPDQLFAYILRGGIDHPNMQSVLRAGVVRSASFTVHGANAPQSV